jgi:hypothetical protein
MDKKLLKNIGIALGAVLFFLVLSYAFVPQVLDGKIVNQSDISGYVGMSHEMSQWNAAHPDDPTYWTDSMFGGMPTTAISTQNVLADLTMNATAFGSAVAGVATANAITADSSADLTGTASWFRLYKSDNTTVICDGSVGTSGADLNLNSVAISSGAAVTITAFTLTESKG